MKGLQSSTKFPMIRGLFPNSPYDQISVKNEEEEPSSNALVTVYHSSTYKDWTAPTRPLSENFQRTFERLPKMDRDSSGNFRTQSLFEKLSGGNDHNGMELRTSNIKNVGRNLSSDLETSAYIPALDASWLGNFCIHDLKHGEWKLRAHAHSPSRVRRKVYEFTKKMPEVLHFELVSCNKFSTCFFRESGPNTHDIGLYFFSSDTLRSDEFAPFWESMYVENLALREQIGEIELLVFTSKILPVGCQFFRGKQFLWGVFHHLKRQPPPSSDYRLLMLASANSGCHQDNSKEVDMDVDMLGGAIVGKIDVPVQKKKYPS